MDEKIINRSFKDEKYSLRVQYATYLERIRNLKPKSIKNYLDAIQYISTYAVKKGLIAESVYEIDDLETLYELLDTLLSDSDFSALDTRGNQMYSSGFRNYIRFSAGDGLDHSMVCRMDVAVPKTTKRKEINYLPRTPIIKKQCLESANYTCEISDRHSTFVAESTGKQYMEAHHIIPLSKQYLFTVGLDVYSNVICLCPICHRLLHYGLECEKTARLEMIYSKRIERLNNSGIFVGKDEFLEVCI